MSKLKLYLLKYKNIPIQIKASIWYTICNIIQKCISFLTIPLFTRLLTTTQYGQINLYQSWQNIIIIFCTLNLQFGSFNTAMIKFKEERDEYISSIQGLCTVLTILIIGMFIIFSDIWIKLFDLPFFIIIIMAIECLFNSCIGLWTGKQRFEYKYKKMVFFTLLLSVFSTILSLMFVFCFVEKGYAKILGNAIVYVILGCLLYFVNFSKSKNLYNKKFWLFAIKFNLPLIPYYLSQMIFNQSDRIMISNMCGVDKAGIYGVAYSLSIVLSFVINSINSSYVPWLYNKIEQNNIKKINKLTTRIVLLISILLISFMLLAPEILNIIAGDNYKEAILIIPPVVGSLFFLFLAQISGNIMFYYEDNYSLIKSSIIGAIVNIILNYFLLKEYGYIVAGYTTLFSYIIFWLMNEYYMKHNERYFVKKDLFNYKFLYIISILFCLTIGLITFLINYTYIRYILIFILIIVLIKFKTKIINIFKYS